MSRKTAIFRDMGIFLKCIKKEMFNQITNILALFNQKSRNLKFCHFTIESGSTLYHRLDGNARLSRI